MIPERLAKIVELLINKTQNRKAIWNKTSGNNQFKLSINDGSAITISKWNNNNNNFNSSKDDEYEVVIFNNNGDAIERFGTGWEGVTKDDNNLLKSFHKAASESYYKVEETMEALLESIHNQDIIGNKEDSTNSNTATTTDEDELPF